MNSNQSKIVDILIGFFRQPASKTKGKVPEGLCPNCWGEQEYDSRFRTMYEDKQIDVNNHQANYAFIQDFVVNRMNGILLVKEKDRTACPVCHNSHPVS
jgi:hypothetical protein